MEELYRSDRQPGRVAAKQEAAGKEKWGDQSVEKHTRRQESPCCLNMSGRVTVP